MKITAFGIKAREDMNLMGNTDLDVTGLHLNLKEQSLEFLLSLDLDATELAEAVDITGTPSTGNDTSRALQRITLNGYTQRNFGDNDLTVNAAIQAGHQMIATGDPNFSFKQDISAVMVAAEFGHKFNDKRNSRVAIGFDYTSGDDGTDSTENKTFDNLYYTGHKFRGFMDYFVPTNMTGLMDVMVRGKTDLTEGWTLKADIHMFKTAEDYSFTNPTTTLTETSSDVGMEIDLTVTTTRVKGVKISGGLSMFSAKDDWAAMMTSVDEKQTGFWGYTQAVVNF
jgi:hypothetical protein